MADRDRGIKVQPIPSQGSQGTAVIGNINSPSVVSLNSNSSDGSAESHVVEPEEMVALTQELKRLKEALGRLKKVFANNDNTTSSHIENEKRKETRRVASHERLSEVLKILRQMLEKYPMLQSNEIVGSAEHLIQQVKNFDYEADSTKFEGGYPCEPGMDVSSISKMLYQSGGLPAPIGAVPMPGVPAEPPREFHDAIEALAHVFSNRVSEYIMGDLESVSVSSTTSSKTKSSENLTSSGPHRSRGGIPTGGLYTGNGPRGSIPHSHHHHAETNLEVIGVPGQLVHKLDTLEQPFGNEFSNETPAAEMLSAEQIDALLMRHDQGVDHALMRAKIWSKYAKDVMTFVDKRTSLELEWAKGLTRLAQTMRPLLKEESYLPFQSIYCTALDQDLEMCATTQSTCSLLHGYKFAEPLAARRNEHEKHRKSLKERWQKELKRIQEAVTNLNNARALYKRRQQEYERCREALRIAEQGAEIGATGENKVDKRKKYEEEALSKKLESESAYRCSVDEANERHRNLLHVKKEVLQQVRELIQQCDQTMKAVTVSYFHLQYTLTSPVPTQFQTLVESTRLYEPGFQYMEYVRRLPEPQGSTSQQHLTSTPLNNGNTAVVTPDPFMFEPIGDAESGARGAVHGHYPDSHRRHKMSLETAGYGMDHSEDQTDGYMRDFSNRRPSDTTRIQGAGQPGPIMAWTPLLSGAIEPSDNESVESGSASPSGGAGGHSPLITNPPRPQMPSEQQKNVKGFSGTSESSKTGGHAAVSEVNLSAATSQPSASIPTGVSAVSSNRRQLMSKAAVTHKFRKLKTPSKCRECDSYVYFQGYECHDCGLSCHKKCLETLALQCGHKRLPRRMTTFGVKLSDHLQETGAQVPPLVCKCVHNIDTGGGINIKGIYRVSGVKHKVEKLCQAFENGAELVDLSDQNPNVVANVLKLYMRQLPEPLLTFTLYPEFIRVADMYPPKSGENGTGGTHKNNNNAQLSSQHEGAVIAELQSLCRKLPRSHLFLLGFLMHHLHRVASEYESNNMTASNLAIVFGPTLLRRNEDTTSMTQVLETIHQARAVELLTIYVEAIFGPCDNLLPKDYHKYTANRHSNPSSHPVTQHGEGAPGTTKFDNNNRPSRYHLREHGSGGSGASGDGDILSSQPELRVHNNRPIGEEFTLPGHVVPYGERFGGGSADDIDIYGASISDDDDDDADPLPWESTKPLKPDDPLLPDGSSSKKLSPLLLLRPSHSSSHSSRPDSERPVISKVNLKNFSGLEGVSSLTLSTQDSVETSSSTNTKSSTSISTTNTGISSTLNINTASASDASPSLGSSLVVTSAKRSIQAEKSAPLTATNYGKADTNSPSSPMAPSTSSSTLFSKVGKSTKKHSLDEEFLNSGTSGIPHSTSSVHPSTTGDPVVGSVAFQGTLDISNYVDDSEDTTDTGSGTSTSTAGGNRGVNSTSMSGFPGRTSSYHYSHGGGRSTGSSTAVHQHSAPHFGSSRSNISIGPNQSVPSGSSPSPIHGTDEAGSPHLPPTAMTIASAEEHRKKISSISSGSSRDGSKSSLSISHNSGTGSTATIVNLEENKVKIKVPGLQQKSQQSQHSSVTKQKSMNN